MLEYEELVKTNNDTKATTNNGNKSSSTQHISIDINNDGSELNSPMLSKDRTEQKSENPTLSRNKIIKYSPIAIAIMVAAGLGILTIVRYVKSILLSPPSLWDSCLDELPVTERNEFEEDMALINEANNPTVYSPMPTQKEAEAGLVICIFAGLQSLIGGIANSANQMEATAGYLSPNDGMVPFDSGKNTRNTKGRRDLHNGNSVHSTPDSVHSLTTISQKVGSELDEQEPEHRQEVQSDQSISQEQRNPNNINISPLTKTSLNDIKWEEYYNTFDVTKIRAVFDVALADYLSGENTYDKDKDNYNKKINELERYKENESNYLKNQTDIYKSKLEELNNRESEEKSSYEICKLTLKNIENYISNNNLFSYENVDHFSDLIDYLIDKINHEATENYGEKNFATNDEVISYIISVAIYYLKYIESLKYSFQETLLNLNNLDKKIIHDIENHHTSNNYLDILKANEISSLIQQQKDHNNITTTIPDESSDEDYFDTTRLRAAVYWMMINKSFDINTFDNITIYTIIKKYLMDERQYNPMQNGATLPEGYYSFLDFKRRKEFDSQREFTTQFNKYKDKYSNYEAIMLTKLHLSSLDLGITPTEIVTPPKKAFSFSIDNHIGKINFLELISGDWLLIAFIDGIIKMKKYKQEEINSNDLLKALKEPDNNFVHRPDSPVLREMNSINRNQAIFPIFFTDYHLVYSHEKFWDNFFENRIKIKGNEPFSHTYDYDRKFPEEYNVFNVINSLLKEGLDNIADKSKITLDDASFLHTIATVLIPFYDVIYQAVTDSDYSPDAGDVVSIAFDSISVIITVMTLGLPISNQVLTKITTRTVELSVRYSGRALLRAVIRELPSMELLDARQVLRLLKSGMIDLIVPLPTKDILKGANKIFRKSISLKKGVQVQNDAINFLESNVNRYNKLPDKWKVPDQGFELMTAGTSDGRFEDIYKLRTSNANIDMQTNYYIKQHGDFWQARWDNDNRTWRIMNPANSGRFNYAIPVKRDNNGLWIRHSDVGLRGGARLDKSAPKHMQKAEVEFEPIRSTTSEKITHNLAEDISAADYLNQLKANPKIREKITNPTGQCESLMEPVARFMQDNGMTDIKYRGMYIWDNAMNAAPMNHFVVVGKKNGKDYVFDLSAHQFENKGMLDLNGPLILEESEWANKYSGASTRKLIKYKDFSNAKSAGTTFNSYPGHHPVDVIEGATVLTEPQWYITAKRDLDISNKKMPVSYSGLGCSNPVRDAARTSILSGSSSQDVCWSFATDVLQKAKVVTDTQAQILIDGLEKAAQYKGISNSGRIDDLFESPRKITNVEQLLRVKEGEMLVFMEVAPNMPNKGARPVHVVASIGNGRFAGMKNSVLDNSLSDGKKIITAEQLGKFEGEGLKSHDLASSSLLDIYAGYPVGAQARYGKSIKEVAQSLTSSGQAGDIGKFISDLLEQSGELAFEQASAFNDVVKALLDPNSVQRTVDHLLTNKRNINNIADLTTLSKGTVVVFQESEYSVKNLMISLGEGEFAIFNPENLGSSFNHADTVVSSSQFGEFSNGKLGTYTVVAGQINVKSMRQSALLGKDSSFGLNGNKLHIKIHGAPWIVNYMDAIEFSDVVRGLSLRAGDIIDFRMVGAIEFQSCYGAFGKQSSGQILADKLGKRVTAYPLKYSNVIAQNPEWWRPRPKIFEPRTLNAGELDRAHKQHMKNHNFWEKLLGLYKGGPGLRRSRREVNLIASSFELLIDDVADLALNKFTVDDFLRLHLEYFGKKNDLYTVMQTELASLIKLAAPTNADSFAELCIAILSLNQFSFDLLDNYLSGNV
ncbi:hypothetical protein [Photorhabdus sp. RM71S]|uniref:hypothetical protein n=1 Tax=Photorhabdus sp. RM71S TaxID=3342824 RepID=UPI0036D83509